MRWRQVPANELLEPQLYVADFFNALEDARSSVSEEDVRRCQEWTCQYGSEGA